MLAPGFVVALSTLEWRAAVAIGAVSAAHALLLGVPVYLLLRWQKWANAFTSVLAGALVGAGPVGVFLFPAGERWSGSSASVGGVPTMVDGVATRAGWESYFTTVGLFAAFGVASGFLFWLFIHWASRREALYLPTDRSEK
jgi:hypothetical protein